MHKDLTHLSEEEIERLMECYYDKNTPIKTLQEEFSLDIPASRLYTMFPPIEFKEYTCENCDSILVATRKSKTSNQYYENDLYCPECGHRQFQDICTCPACEEDRALDIEYRKEKIKQMYGSKIDRVDYHELSFENKVCLGALCNYLLAENMYEILPYHRHAKIYPLAPTIELRNEIYGRLCAVKAIRVSPYSELEAFVDEERFPKVYYLECVRYELNLEFPPNKNELFNEIYSPSYSEEEMVVEKQKLWMKIAVAECLEYLQFQMKLVRFDFNPGEKTIGIMHDILENFSVAQTYGIIWKCIAEGTRLYQEGRVPKQQAANSVIGACKRYADRALEKGWELRPFGRTRDLPQSEIANFFFNHVMKIGERGFQESPGQWLG